MTPWGAPDLAFVKAALRVDAPDDDAALEAYRLSAIRLIEEASGQSDWTHHPQLATAVLLTVGQWYDGTPAATLPPMAMDLVNISRTGWVKA